jgi:hypothetical protein
MRIPKSAILWLVGFLVSAGLVVSMPVFFFKLQSDYCLFNVMGEFPSPNGKQVALVIRESCGGATMPFLTSVAVKETGHSPRNQRGRKNLSLRRVGQP